MKRKTIDIITLGCSKNLVDSEHLMRQLEESGKERLPLSILVVLSVMLKKSPLT